jgi:hypothetical protein
VILVRQRRPEQRHDAITHHLIDGALVAVDGFHHQLEDGIEDLPCLFGITVREQLHRALEIGEEHGDLLPLALQRGLRGEDPVGQVLGRVGLWGGELGRRAPLERGGALAAEAILRRVCRAT